MTVHIAAEPALDDVRHEAIVCVQLKTTVAGSHLLEHLRAQPFVVSAWWIAADIDAVVLLSAPSMRELHRAMDDLRLLGGAQDTDGVPAGAVDGRGAVADAAVEPHDQPIVPRGLGHRGHPVQREAGPRDDGPARRHPQARRVDPEPRRGQPHHRVDPGRERGEGEPVIACA